MSTGLQFTTGAFVFDTSGATYLDVDASGTTLGSSSVDVSCTTATRMGRAYREAGQGREPRSKSWPSSSHHAS